jgi:hypothetical protein
MLIHYLRVSLLFSSAKAAVTCTQSPSYKIGCDIVPTRLMTQHSAAPVQQRRSSRLQKRYLSGADDSQSSEQQSLMNVSELRGLLRERGLAVSGVKSLLVERLSKYVTYGNLDPDRIIEFSQLDCSNIMPKAKQAKAESQLNVLEKIPAQSDLNVHCLPRTRELQLLATHIDTNLAVIGVDEAGRGPLAG